MHGKRESDTLVFMELQTGVSGSFFGVNFPLPSCLFLILVTRGNQCFLSSVPVIYQFPCQLFDFLILTGSFQPPVTAAVQIERKFGIFAKDCALSSAGRF